MYHIRMNNMQFHSHIGVLPEEKVVGQDIQIDLDVEANTQPHDDLLTTTVSYADFYEIVDHIVSNKKVDLIETLAQNIMTQIKKADARVGTVKVTIRKLGLPIDGVLDNVEIEMEQ